MDWPPSEFFAGLITMGGGWVAIKQWAKALHKLMASTGAVFSSTYHKLNPWSTSPASSVMMYKQLSDWPSEIEPFKNHLNT